ncbi:MAG: ATP-binding cassette domain-containing protein [Gemmatimonadota bacterium]|nr:ATP-binding cassette domain-containing protein [Gemmatimonadota bacterium]
MLSPRIVLEAEKVGKRYGEVVALDGASLACLAGSCTAIVGESGSGKTTLLRCFNRMAEPDEGRIRVAGQDVRALDPVLLRRRIGYVPQDGGLLPHWRVARNVALVPWLQDSPDSDARVVRALDLVGLPVEQYGMRWPGELSGGQRQRVAIARALASQPELLLLDEPFGALDAITRAELQESFRQLQRSLGVTSVIVTHDLHEAVDLADRVVVLRGGRVEQDAAPSELVGAPATPYVRELLRRARVSAA